MGLAGACSSASSHPAPAPDPTEPGRSPAREELASQPSAPPLPVEWEDDTRLFSRPAPEESPLVGTLFDAADPLPVRVDKWKTARGKSKPKKKIVIEKRARLLSVYLNDDLVIRYTASLGFAAVGDKEWEGDGKTPEGTLYVCTRNEKSKYHRFLGLSYPQPEDATRGFADGKLTAAERDEIITAHKAKKAPNWNTALGGAVGIHGGSRVVDWGGRHYGYDWTWGCIGLTNEQSLDLFNFAELGTPVEIVP